MDTGDRRKIRHADAAVTVQNDHIRKAMLLKLFLAHYFNAPTSSAWEAADKDQGDASEVMLPSFVIMVTHLQGCTAKATQILCFWFAQRRQHRYYVDDE